MHELTKASELLLKHYGRQAFLWQPRCWETLVMVVLTGGRTGKTSRKVEVLLDESPLGSAWEIREAASDEIAKMLETIPRGRQKVAMLGSLADWWAKRFAELPVSHCPIGLEALREELRQIRGVGHELADRMLLFVFDRPVYPLDRASVRLACRHGWLTLEDDYDLWQTFYTEGLDRSLAVLQEFSLWAGRVGKDFCGPRPKCEACPLRSELPRGGPYEPNGS